jgi:MbtH protein
MLRVQVGDASGRKMDAARTRVLGAPRSAGLNTVPEGSLAEEEQDDATVYKVVVNDEEQYSIWPAHRENAPGWRDAGKNGTRADCLSYIESVWTDMRPLSLRRRMGDAPPREDQA